ncbi:sensor histidine kinase [Luteimonas vadosa]|uniref:Sensor histidine kinase n=1 Tax=Luteimonas vadosa TaxID=1165507 RepID=A0ABP9DPM0_9GAMM
MSQAGAPATWLPDLCRLPRLATMLALAELVVVVIALAPDGLRSWSVDEFLAASAYALWLTLTVSVLLCVARPRLSRLPMSAGMALALVLSALVALAASAIAHAVLATLFPADVRPAFWRFLGGSTAITVLIFALALRYFHAVDRWQAQVSAHARAEADALQARIRPHFLFNSMNMIASLVRRDPLVAERAVLDLSDLFRAALGAGTAPSTLADEVSLAEQYLAIEQLRLGERLQVAWDKQEPLPWALAMPRLVLQPLLENAVLHGISRLPEGGLIEVSLAASPQRLSIRIRNPAPPRTTIGDGASQGSGHAQRSIGHRLQYAYGPRARMACRQDGSYYDCELSLPLD